MVVHALLNRNKYSIRDAYTPQPGKIVFDKMRYRKNKIVQRSGDLVQIMLAQIVTFKREKISVNYEGVKFIN